MGLWNKVRKGASEWAQGVRAARAERAATRAAEAYRAAKIEQVTEFSENAAEGARFASTFTQSFESLLGRLRPLVNNQTYRKSDDIIGNKGLQIEIDRSLTSLKETVQGSLEASKKLVGAAMATQVPEFIEAANKVQKAAEEAWQAAALARSRFHDMLSSSALATPEAFLEAGEHAVRKLKEAEEIAWKAHKDIATNPKLLAGVAAPVLGGEGDESKVTTGETTWNAIAGTTSLAAETVIMPAIELVAPVLDTVDEITIAAVNTGGSLVTGGNITNAGVINDKAQQNAIQRGVIAPMGLVIDKAIKPTVVTTVDHALTPLTKIPGQVAAPFVNLMSRINPPTPEKIDLNQDKVDRRYVSYTHVPEQKPTPRNSDEVWAEAAGKNQSVEAFTPDTSVDANFTPSTSPLP